MGTCLKIMINSNRNSINNNDSASYNYFLFYQNDDDNNQNGISPYIQNVPMSKVSDRNTFNMGQDNMIIPVYETNSFYDQNKHNQPFPNSWDPNQH